MAMPSSWGASPAIPASFPDGTANTLLFAEKYARCGSGGSLWGQATADPWLPVFAAWSYEPFQARPSPAECDPLRASTSFSGAIQVALADASVRGVRAGIDPLTWRLHPRRRGSPGRRLVKRAGDKPWPIRPPGRAAGVFLPVADGRARSVTPRPAGDARNLANVRAAFLFDLKIPVGRRR
jgi:hypothetical protein